MNIVKTSLYDGCDYEANWSTVSRKKLHEAEMALIGELLPNACSRLVDFGCGFGRLLPLYAERASEIVLFDGAVHLLKRAEILAKHHGVRRCLLVLGDVNQSPFADGSFDCVLMVRVLHHQPDAKRALAEVSRMTSLGGHAVISYDNKQHPGRVLKWLVDRSKTNPMKNDVEEYSANLWGHRSQFIRGLLNEQNFFIESVRGAGIVNKVVHRLGPLGTHLPAQLPFSAALANLDFAPEITIRTLKSAGEQFVPLGGDIFVCPVCRSSIRKSSSAFVCAACSRSFPIDANVFDFRI